jgi:hypothetical protein
MANDTIVLSPELPGVKREALADAAITPGHLVEITATGVAVQSGAAATGGVLKAFATENISIAGGVADAYAVGENCFFHLVQSGCVVNARVADGTYAVGDLLEATGNGTLRAVTTGDAVAVVETGATTTGTALLSVIVL